MQDFGSGDGGSNPPGGIAYSRSNLFENAYILFSGLNLQRERSRAETVWPEFSPRQTAVCGRIDPCCLCSRSCTNDSAIVQKAASGVAADPDLPKKLLDDPIREKQWKGRYGARPLSPEG